MSDCTPIGDEKILFTDNNSNSFPTIALNESNGHIVMGVVINGNTGNGATGH